MQKCGNTLIEPQPRVFLAHIQGRFCGNVSRQQGPLGRSRKRTHLSEATRRSIALTVPVPGRLICHWVETSHDGIFSCGTRMQQGTVPVVASCPYPSKKFQPTDVSFQSRAIGVATRNGHTLVGLAGRACVAWGSNGKRQLGRSGVGGPTPETVQLPGKAAGVAAGWEHSLAMLEDSTCSVWGTNANGQLGCTAGGGGPSPVLVSMRLWTSAANASCQ